MIEIKNLKVCFEKKEVLHGIDLHIPKNRITAVIGQSGCGKSTLLKSLNRMVEEEGGSVTGEIRMDGQDIQVLSKEELRKKIGMVFQQPVAFPFSVEKNLTYVLDYHHQIPKSQIKNKVMDALKKVKLYEEVQGQMNLFAPKLSGGQKQRLAIARSLCVDPTMLMLDEPCSALDIKNTIAIEQLLMEIKEQYTILIVTHNIMQAKRIADDIVLMDHGKVLEITEKEEFFSEPKTIQGKELILYV